MAYKPTDKMINCITWICKMIEPTLNGRKDITEDEIEEIFNDYYKAQKFISQNIDAAKAMYGKPTIAMKRTLDRIFKEVDIKSYINKEAIYNDFNIAKEFINDNINKLDKQSKEYSDSILSFVYNQLNKGKINMSYISRHDKYDDYYWGTDKPSRSSKSSSVSRDDYETYISDCALSDAEDGEHGCGIAGRYSNYKSELSYEEYKDGRRLKGHGGY